MYSFAIMEVYEYECRAKTTGRYMRPFLAQTFDTVPIHQVIHIFSIRGYWTVVHTRSYPGQPSEGLSQ